MTEAPEVVRDDLFGARPATVDRHPILGLDPVNCTPQLGRPGPWSARLPYFRMGFTPSAGEELQSEYLVPREHAGAAIEAVRAPGRPHPPGPPGLRDPHDRRRPAVDEPAVRARHASASTSPGRSSPRPSRDVLADLEPALEPFDPRPHWGKLFLHAPRYERVADFARLAEHARPARRVQERVARSPGTGSPMTVTTFGIIGTGWRSEFFLRLARAAPDRFRATGVVSRSAERGAEITARWGPPAFESVAALLRAEAPDFVIPCVPWAAMPDATRELVGLGARVLAETPPAPDLPGLRALWADVGDSGLVQVAEQYLLMPGHAARLAIVGRA